MHLLERMRCIENAVRFFFLAVTPVKASVVNSQKLLVVMLGASGACKTWVSGREPLQPLLAVTKWSQLMRGCCRVSLSESAVGILSLLSCSDVAAFLKIAFI